MYSVDLEQCLCLLPSHREIITFTATAAAVPAIRSISKVITITYWKKARLVWQIGGYENHEPNINDDDNGKNPRTPIHCPFLPLLLTLRRRRRRRRRRWRVCRAWIMEDPRTYWHRKWYIGKISHPTMFMCHPFMHRSVI